MRPAILHVGGTMYWVIRTYNPDTLVLKDADSTPTVAVRKNGSSTGDAVTVTKRSATTGIYDCSYNPASEVEGDEFVIEETATITGTTTAQATYSQSWSFTVIAVERGTDSAYTGTPPTAVAISNQVASDLATAHGSGAWTTATGFATPVNVTDAVTSIKGADNDTLKSLSDQIDGTATGTDITSVSNKLGTPAGASVSADIASVKVDTGNLASRITSTLFSGITQLSRWLGALAGKTADSTTLTEIQATTAGASYNNTTDSLEAIRDRGDAAWITGSSSGGLTSEQNAALNRIDAKAALITGGKLQVAGSVTPGGDIRLYLGSDYLVSAESELLRSISDTGGALHTRLQAAESIEFGAGRNGVPNLIRGTVTSAYASNVTTLTIEIDGAADIDIAQAIASEDYTYQIRRVTAEGKKVTEVEGNLTLITDYIG